MAKQRQAPAEAQDREEGIADAINRLAEEVQLLRIALDELREEFQWAVRNPTEAGPRIRITSLAADPAAPDFGERINAVPTEQLEAMRSELAGQRSDQAETRPTSEPAAPETQRRLW